MALDDLDVRRACLRDRLTQTLERLAAKIRGVDAAGWSDLRRHRNRQLGVTGTDVGEDRSGMHAQDFDEPLRICRVVLRRGDASEADRQRRGCGPRDDRR